MTRELRIRWSIAAAYAVAVLAIGAVYEWHAPLRYDEWFYYVPTLKLFASRLPAVPLDYGTVNVPPLMLAIEGWIYALTHSIALLRALSSVAMIATVCTMTALMADVNGPSARLVPLLVALFPTNLLHTFTLKHYAFELLFVTLGLWAIERRRCLPAALSFTAAVFTRQTALAFIGALIVERLPRWRDRDARRELVALAIPVACAAALFVAWRGTTPPAFRRFAAPQAIYRTPLWFVWQALVALFVIGTWIVPAADGWWRKWRVMLAALPVAFFALAQSQLLLAHDVEHPGFMYRRMIGPVSSIFFRAFASPWPRVAAAALLVAIGASIVTWRGAAPRFAAIYAVMMFAVPTFFENYYTALVSGAWLLMREPIARSSSVVVRAFQAGVILAGIGYLIIGPSVG